MQEAQLTHNQRMEQHLAEVDRETEQALGLGAPELRQELRREQEAGEEEEVRGEEDRQEEEVNGFLRDMANILDQQGLQGPAVAAGPVQQAGWGGQPGDREEQRGDVYVVAGRERPELPLPLPGPVAAGDGWEAFDRVGAEAAFRVCCPLLRAEGGHAALQRLGQGPRLRAADVAGGHHGGGGRQGPHVAGVPAPGPPEDVRGAGREEREEPGEVPLPLCG